MSETREALESMIRRQRVLADFGDFALQSEDLDAVLTEACRLVAEALGTGRAKVLEIEPGGESLFVRAGVGWASDVVGRMHVPMGETSSESYSIRAGEPVITQDISKEERFEVPAFMKQAGIVALANAPVFLPGKRPYGLLQVDDTEPRDFDEADTEFLRTYCTILGPVIDRLLKLRDLRASEERFRLTVEAATDYAVFITDDEDRITDWLPGAAAVFGWSAAEVVGQPAAVLFTPEDREAGVPEQEVETARREGSAPDVRWHQRHDGSRVFIDGVVRALHDIQGAPEGFIKIGQDVTARHEAEERQKVLVAELQHRTRNLIGVVRSIANQTMAYAGPTEAFREEFNHRMAALARVQGLLSRAEQEPITLRALLRLELDALGAKEGERVRLRGPSVRIRPSIVQTLALVLHELATNARKYGALSEGGGRLSIEWHRQDREGERRIFIEWHEEELATTEAAPSAPERGGGYGRRLIEKALPYALDAETTYDLQPTRLRCTIDLPLDRPAQSR